MSVYQELKKIALAESKTAFNHPFKYPSDLPLGMIKKVEQFLNILYNEHDLGKCNSIYLDDNGAYRGNLIFNIKPDLDEVRRLYARFLSDHKGKTAKIRLYFLSFLVSRMIGVVPTV